MLLSTGCRIREKNAYCTVVTQDIETVILVEQVFETDCNGATVGSVLGMAFGIACISGEWLVPLCGMLKARILDIGTVSIEALLDKTLRHIAEK